MQPRAAIVALYCVGRLWETRACEYDPRVLLFFVSLKLVLVENWFPNSESRASGFINSFFSLKLDMGAPTLTYLQTLRRVHPEGLGERPAVGSRRARGLSCRYI